MAVRFSCAMLVTTNVETLWVCTKLLHHRCYRPSRCGQVWNRAVTAQIELGRLRAAAAACDPQAVSQARNAAVRDALLRANSASAEIVEKLHSRVTAAEVSETVPPYLSACLSPVFTKQ